MLQRRHSDRRTRDRRFRGGKAADRRFLDRRKQVLSINEDMRTGERRGPDRRQGNRRADVDRRAEQEE